MFDRDFFEKYAQDNKMMLSPMADKVIKAINDNDGFCPCRIEKVKCPCPMHKDEVEQKGRCTCNLFVKKDNE